MRVFGDRVDARRKLDLDRTDAPGRKVRPKNVEDIKLVEVFFVSNYRSNDPK